MAGSYQVPQFLDSGDKIIGPLNLRQFAYAFIGSFLVFGIFNVFASVSTIVGIIAAAPLAIFIAFLSFGKFNGRDSEIYLFKLAENLRKPKVMKYAKKAQTPLLDQRLTKLNPTALNAELDKRYAEIIRSKAQESDFRHLPVAEKIAKIKNITNNIDINTQQEFGSLYSQELENKKTDESNSLGSTSIYNKIFSSGPRALSKTEQKNKALTAPKPATTEENNP